MALPHHPLFSLRTSIKQLALASCCITALSLAPMQAGAATDDYVILEINGNEVTRSEVENIWQSVFPGQNVPAFETVDEEVKVNILRGVVGEHLLMQKALESNLEERADVQRRLEAMRKKLLVDAFLEEKSASAVTPAAIKAAYDQYRKEASKEKEIRARHILVEEKAEADKIITRLKKGEPFNSIAKATSKDQVSAVSGGDLGYFTKDKMVKEFSDAAFALKKDAISEPVKSDFGWHIINVTDIREQEVKPFAEMRDPLEQKLRGEALGSYIHRLIESADVVYFDKDGKKMELDVHDSTADARSAR